MENNELEFQKLMFEFFKHLTTLNAATAVIVPTVAVALHLRFMTSVVALALFAVSVGCSGWGMFKTARRVKDKDNSAPRWSLIVACTCILLGVAYFSIATIVERLL